MPEGKTLVINSLDSNETSTSSLKRPVSRNEIKTTNFNEELSVFQKRAEQLTKQTPNSPQYSSITTFSGKLTETQNQRRNYQRGTGYWSASSNRVRTLSKKRTPTKGIGQEKNNTFSLEFDKITTDRGGRQGK